MVPSINVFFPDAALEEGAFRLCVWSITAVALDWKTGHGAVIPPACGLFANAEKTQEKSKARSGGTACKGKVLSELLRPNGVRGSLLL